MTETRNTNTHDVDLLIVGAGLAGLTAAVTAARGGASVVLAERASALGGRAQTHRSDEGFSFNIGPHALYAGAAGTRILGELGVEFSGHTPKLSGAFAVHGGDLHALPGGFVSLLTTGFLSAAEKLELARILTMLPRLDTAAQDHVTLQAWLETNVKHEGTREQIAALSRLTAYQNHPGLQSAGASLEQIRLALKASVNYVDGGWQTLVDGLEHAARHAGVEILTRTKAENLRFENEHWRFGEPIADFCGSAANVIMAVPPAAAAAALPGVDSIARWRDDAVPVEAATLDIALSKLPKPKNLFALGVDEPLYFSVHSATADLAPRGGALIHAAVYLGDKAPTGKAAEARLERLVDVLQPGWRDHLVERRFLPSIAVVNGLPTAAQGGLAGRPGPAVPGQEGLYVAGDWVGPEGLLADAAIASGQQAARAVLARTVLARSADAAVTRKVA
jgi:phytoene dehydrogenase-like protein